MRFPENQSMYCRETKKIHSQTLPGDSFWRKPKACRNYLSQFKTRSNKQVKISDQLKCPLADMMRRVEEFPPFATFHKRVCLNLLVFTFHAFQASFRPLFNFHEIALFPHLSPILSHLCLFLEIFFYLRKRTGNFSRLFDF